MKIYIPSAGRADNQQTLYSLPDEMREKAILVVYEDEAQAYRRHGVDMLVLPRIGIARKRQIIIESALRGPDAKGCCIILDDDLSFAVRRCDEPTKFVAAQVSDVGAAMTELWESLMSGWKHVGMASREGGNRDTREYLFATRALRVHGFNCRALEKHNIGFSDVELMEDFHVTLSLLKHGYENKLLNWIVHDQKGSNTKGGCSDYRTLERQAKAAHRLKELHPEFVEIVTKKTKTAWGGQERTDVKIAWKRALASAAVLDQREIGNPEQEGTGATETVE